MGVLADFLNYKQYTDCVLSPQLDACLDKTSWAMQQKGLRTM